MIPVRLALRNFMCYRDDVPTLNLSGIRLACLSGDNGNGKSALIDAMTWALWGETRARSDDDLVYAGRGEMAVEFDFAVGQQVYRVLRKHSRPKRPGRPGHTTLEFQIATGNGFRAISGEGVVQTQRKIIDVLHMDYDTFINSAYLRQGHADEFTRQPPAKRKEVLASILGFALYDGLEEQSRELAKEQEAEKAELETTINDIGQELIRKPAFEAELVRAQAETARIESSLKEKEAELNSQRQKRESLEQKRAQLEQLQAHMQDMTGQLELWNEQTRQHQARLKEYGELTVQRPAIEEGYGRLVEARKLGDELERKSRRVANLNQHKHHLEIAIERAKQELLKEHALARYKINDLETRARRLPAMRDQLLHTEGEWHQLAEHEDVLSQKKQAVQGLQDEVSQLASSVSRLEQEIREAGEKLALLSTHTETKCPLCERELGAQGLELIQSKYAAEERSKSSALKANQAGLASKKAQLDLLKVESSHVESRLGQDRAALQSKIGILKKEMAEAEEAEKRLSQEGERLVEIEQRLARREFASAELGALAQVEGELARLAYDPERHEQVRNLVLELEQYEGSHRKLDEADRLTGQEKQAEAAAEAAAAKLRSSLDIDSQHCQTLAAELAVLPAVLEGLKRVEREFADLSAEKAQAQEALWSVKNSLARCAELEARRKEKESQLAQAGRQEGIYRELAEAFGKRGIQALLIEMVLPEIEVEANRLLGRMTDNRMHVKFETQRETRKGSVVETLDINIADELGTRNYEMFSGGEAFRINFAIRIALSRLLARRAGAPLPTLIIDEGFGTQDVTGVEKLKEAINSIQDDFEKIIVITHIEDLRDAFPTRIDVVKTADGSTFSVN